MPEKFEYQVSGIVIAIVGMDIKQNELLTILEDGKIYPLSVRGDNYIIGQALEDIPEGEALFNLSSGGLRKPHG